MEEESTKLETASEKPKRRIRRRTILKLGILGAFLLLFYATIGKLFWRKPAKGLKLLTAKELDIVSAMADTFFPKGGAISRSGTEAGVPEYVDDFLHETDKTTRQGLVLLLNILELGGAISDPGSRFTKMSPLEREEYLNGLILSDNYYLRSALSPLKMIFGMGYFDNQAVLDEIGYYVVCE